MYSAFASAFSFFLVTSSFCSTVGLNKSCIVVNKRSVELVSEERLSQALATLSQALNSSDDSPDGQLCRAVTLGNLANAHRSLGDMQLAEQETTASVLLFEKLLGKDSVALRHPLENLVNVAIHKRALTKASQLLKRLEALPEPSHRDLATVRGLQAIVLMLQYKDHEAEGELQKALQERELAGESNSMEVVPERVGNAENPTSVGRPTKPIVLSEDERAKLQEWARRPKTAQRSALRARIVLSCAEGIENRTVARQLRITDQTVCKWRERFRIARLVACRSEFLSTSEPTLHAKSSGQGASWRFRDLHVAKVFPATGH